jgi:TonB-dependent receptor
MRSVAKTSAKTPLRAILLCGIAVIAPFASAQAQTADPGADAEPAIVVTGARPIAESEAAALKVQRSSDSLVTVAASDSVGRLPDQNIAQAASRLPGLAIERDQGQARYISLRGAPNYWTTLSFDGINVVSPEGRDARFDSIPSAIASQILVSKAVTPEMPGETVAGNVNIITRSAFDYPGFKFAAKAGYGKAELGDRPQYEGSAVISGRIPTGGGEVGILLSASYFQRDMITDNFEIDYERVGTEIGVTPIPATGNDKRPGWESRLWAHETENKLYRLTRKNYSASGRLDWKPDNANTITLQSIFSIFTDDEARDNYRFDLDDRQGDLATNTAACTIAANLTPTTSGYADVCIGNTPQVGTIYGIDIRQRSTLRAFRQSILTNTIRGEHEFAEGWKFEWLGNFTESKDDRSVVGEASWDSPGTRTLRPTVSYDFSDPDQARLLLFTTLQLSGPTRFQAGTPVTAIDSFAKPLTTLTALDAVDTTRAYTAKAVITHEASLLGAEASLKLGFQFDQRTKAVEERSMSVNNALVTSLGLSTDYNQFSLSTPFLGEIPMGYTFRYFDQATMRRYVDAARGLVGMNVSQTNRDNFYEVRERVYAGFAMGTLRYDWGSILGGVRIEHVTNTGVANVPGAATGQILAEASRTLVFPSLHFNYDLDDTKKLRLSFNTGAARADYDQLRPNVVVNDSNQTISGGNPGVKPERAWGLDGYFEWYMRPQGYLMAGVFYKKVNDVLYRQTRTFGSDALNYGGVDRSGYQFSGITNGGGGRVFGFEAAAQLQLEPWTEKLGLPDWMGGFGISANLTFNDSEVTKPVTNGVPARKVRLPGTSDWVYNVGAYYEKYGLSLRLQYQRRSLWLDAIADDLVDAGDTYWDADDELDFSTRYAITPNIEVFFDATNLLNKPGRRFSEPGNLLTALGVPTPFTSIQTIEWERFGRRFTGGMRVNF